MSLKIFINKYFITLSMKTLQKQIVIHSSPDKVFSQMDDFSITDRRDSPLNILKKRFASGIITIEEYKEKKEILGDSSSK